jgi:octaprenyl-diphosphate synthase
MNAPTAVAEGQVSAALKEIQAPVRDQLDRVAVEMHEIMAADHPLIRQVITHLLQMRGKLFRPTLALLASATDFKNEPKAVTLGATIELMHLATLVHDDSIDHSVLRRGLPTVNSMFSHQISVIMGDFLYSRSLSALVRVGDMRIMRVVTDVTNELAMGEMYQLGAIDRLGFTEREYFKVIRSKTASLLAAACETGAYCGAPMHSETLSRYGEKLGMIFQITDDIIDYLENEKVTGKPGGSDLKEHKVTLPLIAALPRLSPAGRRSVDELFKTESPSDAQVAEVVAIVADAGGIDAAKRHGEQFKQEAEEALSAIPESPARGALSDAIGYVMERRS